jgi:hypothetical protein
MQIRLRHRKNLFPRLEEYEMLNDFLDANRGKKMLFLEPGAGFTAPPA